MVADGSGETSVLVIGAGGFIGKRCLQTFATAGWRVTGLDLPGRAPELPPGVRFIEGSLDRPQEIAATLGATRYDVVLCLAAFSQGGEGLASSSGRDPEAAIALNLLGFRRLLEVCAAGTRPRVLWTSSVTVFGPRSSYDETTVTETAERRPLSVYGLSKSLAEQAAQFARDTQGLQVTGLRLPLVFGPGYSYRGMGQALADLVEAAVARRPATLVLADRPFDLCYVADAAAALLALARHPAPTGPLYHATGFSTTGRAFVDVLRQVSGYPELRWEEGADLLHWPLLNTNRLRDEIGFTPAFDVRTALVDYLQRLNPDQS